MSDRFIVDRIEDGVAVLEDAQKHMRDVPLDTLPEGVREGDLLVLEAESYRIDQEGTSRRREAVRDRMKRLWK